MPYPKKKKLKIPYLVSIVFPTGVWALLCAAFGAFLILSRADFEATGTRTVFIIAFPIFAIFTVLLAFVEYGILRFIGIKKEKEYLRILNDNIIDGRLLPGLPKETIKKIFYALFEQPSEGLRAGYKYGALIISLTLFTEWLASGRQVTNLPIIFVGGLISYLLVALFGSFVAEKSIYSAIKQCRMILIERGEEIEEPKLTSLKRKFNYFLVIPGLIVAAIFSFIPYISLNIIIFSFIGLILIVVVNYLLSSLIYRAFLEVEDFAKELPKGKKVIFSTGSLTKEITSLSKSLNKAANEIYISRKEIEKRTKKLEEERASLETKVKARTQELQKLAISLEKQVEERTKKLGEERDSLEIKVRIRTKELRELSQSLEEKVKKRTKELQEKVAELEKIHKLIVGRELKMIELKKEVKELKKK